MPRHPPSKPYNDGQWTEARFNAFIKGAFRAACLRWGPRHAVKKKSWISRGQYLCAGYLQDSHVVPATKKYGGKRTTYVFVDHIEPVVDPIEGFTTWDNLIERMFVEESGLQVLCKTCHIRKTNNERKLKSRKEQPLPRLLYSARANAKRKGLDFDLDISWIEARWTGFCELTGLEFNMGYGTEKSWRSPYLPSIDRIDPKKGYLKSNCRMVLLGINMFKGVGSDSEMIDIASALLKEWHNE